VAVARHVERFEFVPESTEHLEEWMGELVGDPRGWINLLPGFVAEPEREGPGLFSVFGGRQPGVSMCTWIPPRPGRRGPPVTTVGILHSLGGPVRATLIERGLDVPPRWRVDQDHARRGLIALVPTNEPHSVVLGWLLPAGSELSNVELTGSWQAEVHLRR